MKKQYKIILIVVIVLVSLVGFGWSKLQPKVVELETAEVGDLGMDFQIQGTLIPKYSAILNSASNGVIKEIPYQAGVAVTQGTVLLRMGYESQADLEIQREQYKQQLVSARQTYDRLFGVNGTAQGSFETAQSNFTLAERNYQNGKILAADGSISQVELNLLENLRSQAKQMMIQAQEENSESSRNYHQQLIESYETQLETMESAVNPGELTMPYDGVIWEVYQEEGAYAGSNQPMMKVYQPVDMKIQASLLTEDAVQLKPGQIVSCKYADGTIVDGEIQFISTVAGQTLSTIGMEENRCIVEVKPEQVPEGVGAGHQVDLTFSVIVVEQALSVSTSALVPVSDGDGIYVVERGKAVLKKIETGKKSGGKVEVTAGLEEGMVVVTDPYEEEVKAGNRVKER